MRDSYTSKKHCRHTKCGRMRGMVVGEGGRSSGILLYRYMSRCGTTREETAEQKRCLSIYLGSAQDISEIRTGSSSRVSDVPSRDGLV